MFWEKWVRRAPSGMYSELHGGKAEGSKWMLHTRGPASQLMNPKLRELKSFRISCRKTCPFLWRKMLFLFSWIARTLPSTRQRFTISTSKAVDQANILEKMVRDKSSQCLCTEDAHHMCSAPVHNAGGPPERPPSKLRGPTELARLRCLCFHLFILCKLTSLSAPRFPHM